MQDQILNVRRKTAGKLFLALGLQLCASLELWAAIPLGAPPSPLYVTNRSAAQLASALGVANLSGLYTTNTSAAALLATIGAVTNGQTLSFDAGLLTNLNANNITGVVISARNQPILPVDAKDGYLYDYRSGVPSPVPGYFVTGKLPVIPGHSYIATIPLSLRVPGGGPFLRYDWVCWDRNTNYLGTIYDEQDGAPWVTNAVAYGRVTNDVNEGFYLRLSPTCNVHFVACALPRVATTHTTNDFTRWLSYFDWRA